MGRRINLGKFQGLNPSHWIRVEIGGLSQVLIKSYWFSWSAVLETNNWIFPSSYKFKNSLNWGSVWSEKNPKWISSIYSRGLWFVFKSLTLFECTFPCDLISCNRADLFKVDTHDAWHVLSNRCTIIVEMNGSTSPGQLQLQEMLV